MVNIFARDRLEDRSEGDTESGTNGKKPSPRNLDDHDRSSKGHRRKRQSFGSGGEEQNSMSSFTSPSPRLSLGFVIRSMQNSSNPTDGED